MSLPLKKVYFSQHHQHRHQTPNAIHGNLYHAKLLTHFMLRAVASEHEFKMAAEKPELGGKFDDIVFSFIVHDGSAEGKVRHRYLQAKHRLDESLKIKASHLLPGTGDTKFNLPKYFSSYCKIAATVGRENVQDCVICTNIGFDEASLLEKGIELVSVKDPLAILLFEKLKNGKAPKLYKLNVSKQFLDSLKNEVRNIYKTWILSDINLERKMKHFFKKLVFVVESPNESELDLIRNKEISEYFQLENDGEFQSAFILKEILDWLKIPKSPWMTAEDAKKILEKTKNLTGSQRILNISIEYQVHQLNKIEFNVIAVREIAEKLGPFLTDSSIKITTISSPFPQCTATKVVAALQKILEPNSDSRDNNQSYLLMPSHYMHDQNEVECWKETFNLNDSHRFLVIVYQGDDFIREDQYYLNLIHANNKKTVILIGGDQNYKKGHSSVLQDTIHYRDLSDSSKNKLLSKTILFQGNELTLRDIIGDRCPDEIIDFPSMEEFLDGKPLMVPSFAIPNFAKFFYIKRRMKSLCSLGDRSVLDEIENNLNIGVLGISEKGKSIKLHSNGRIEWIGIWDDDQKLKIWERAELLLMEKTNFQSLVAEEEFLNDHSTGGKFVIISGLAGAGKSTLMSHQYEEIKKSNPHTWVIRLNLSQHSDAFLNFDHEAISPENATDFFVEHFPAVFNNSAFTRALFKYRISTSGKIVLLLDGFDEIGGRVQEKVIAFIKALEMTKLQKIFITTRPHMKHLLQDQLFQFAYNLENFYQTDQVDYLTEFWQTKLNAPSDESIQQFASSIVEQVSETLKDEERSFIGIPLQCRIMAECFQSDAESILEKSRKETEQISSSSLEKSLLQQDFTLITLYQSFMDTKRRVFCEEKTNTSTSNPIVNYALNHLIKRIERDLTKLAIESIVDDQEKVKVFWPDVSTHQSLADQVEEDRTMAEFTVKYGLTYIDGVNAKLHFIHRTFAEYLFAQYLFQGFILDDTKHNRLLDREAVRRLIVSDVWVRDKYNGVRFFFDAMLKNLIESEEWCNIFYCLTDRLPDRLFEIFTDENLLFFPIESLANNYSTKSRFKTLTTIVLGRYKNIFAFLCDGLDLTMDRVSLRKLMRYTFDDHFYFVEQEDYYAQCSYILKKRLKYCEGDKEVKAVLLQMMYIGPHSSISTMKHTQPHQEERKINLKIALDFMGEHREILKKLQEKNNSDMNKFKSEMLEVLILNEYYGSLSKQYLEILSFLYKDKDSSLAELLSSAIATCFGKSANSNGTIEDFMPTLRDLGRTNVVNRISHLILKLHPTAFEHFYLAPLQEEENISDSADIQLLLARDLGGMTRLHRAAFYGDLEVSTRFLNKVNDSFVRGNPENKKMAKVVIDYYMARDDSGLTPLHIAATRGHQKVVRVTLEFFKKILSDHKLRKDLTKTDGILNKIMKDAITHKNCDMFRLVLKSVKQFLGQGYVLDLLRSLNTAYHDATFLEITAEVQGDSKGYEFLQNLVFKEKIEPQILRQLGHQVLVGMLTVKGWNDGVKRLLDYNLEEGFYTLAHLFEKLENDQISQIVHAITLPSNGTSSYWAKWLSQEIAGQEGEGGPMLKSINCYKYLVKWIWIHLGEGSLRDVLIQDDCKPVIRVLLECFEENPINVALAYLSDGIRKEVGVGIIKNLCPIMRDMFIDSSLVPETDVYIIWMNVLELITDYANERQLSKFVNTISHKHDFGGTRRNIWSVFFDYSGTVENMLVKLYGFFKCLSEKLGENILKDLLLQNEAQTITRALLRQKGLSIDLALAYLSEESKSEVRKSIIDSLPQTMENLILDQESDSLPPGLCPVFEMWSDSEKSLCFDWTIMLELLVDYADKSQLAKFVKFILSYNFSNGNCISVWGEWFAKRHEPQLTFRVRVNTFLRCVSEKLGSETVKDLLLHEGKNGFIIRRAAELDGILELIMLTYLSDEHKMDVKRLTAN